MTYVSQLIRNLKGRKKSNISRTSTIYKLAINN